MYSQQILLTKDYYCCIVLRRPAIDNLHREIDYSCLIYNVKSSAIGAILPEIIRFLPNIRSRLICWNVRMSFQHDSNRFVLGFRCCWRCI